MAQIGTAGKREKHLESKLEDHSVLIKPINLGLAGVQHVLQSMQNGTAEVRNLLINECSLIYECKVCKSLHRSLANFLAHKRVYCLTHCCESLALFSQEDIENETVIVQPESPDSGAAVNEEDAMNDEPDGTADEVDQKEILNLSPKIYRPSATPDLKTRHKNLGKAPSNLMADASGSEDGQKNFLSKCAKHLEHRNVSRTVTTIKMEPIEGNPVAVLQKILPPISIRDFEAVNSKPPAPAFPAAKVVSQKPKESEAGLKNWSCYKCGAQFCSVKSMRFHLKTIHAKRRSYFSCPFCNSRFSQIWGVVRHLMSVHKKSKEQANRLRPKIQKCAMLRVQADKDTDEDSDGEVNNNQKSSSTSRIRPTVSSSVRLNKSLPIHRCTKCSKIFTDKAALELHSDKCGTRRDRDKTKTCKMEEEKTSAVKANERPKRTVKKKRAEDFVDSSQLSIHANSVACKGEKAIKVPPLVEKRILEIVNLEQLSCVKCDRKFISVTNLRRHAAAHIGWSRFKCAQCDYHSYSRSECLSHAKRKHITLKRQHKQVDSFVLDVPNDEVEKNMANGEMKLSPPSCPKSPRSERDDGSTKSGTDNKKRCPISVFEDKQNGGGPNKTAEKNLGTLGNRRPGISQPPPSFNISTRLSPRTFDTSPYQRSDTSFSLVTRSGAYLKTEFKNSGTKKEIFPPQENDNQKVLRTKTIQLKLPETPAAAGSDCGNSNNFANHGDHNYSVEMKDDDVQNSSTDETT